MKKFVIVLLIFCIFCTVPAFAAEELDPAVLSGCHSLQARVPLAGTAQLLSTAKAVVLYELNSESLVYGYNMDQQLDPSGMVKFMTAWIACERGDLSAKVTVTRSALQSVVSGAVSADLVEGEELTLEELLYCVMVASANDACAVIAEHIAGSQKAFVQLMNEKARQIGCEDTRFLDPHGLSESGQVSTARDLAVIVENALRDPYFSVLFSAPYYVVPATNKSEERKLETTNYMLSKSIVANYYDERVTGGKPAAVSIEDRSMICTAESGNSRYLCVVMNAQSVLTPDGGSIVTHSNFTETAALLDYAFYNFSVQQVIDATQMLCQYGVSGGENDVVMHPSADVFAVLPTELDMDKLVISERVDPGKLVAPLNKGDVLGTVNVSYGTVVLGNCDLIAQYSVSKDGYTIRPAAPAEKDEAGITLWKILGWILLGLVCLAVIFTLGLVGLRLYRSARIQVRRRRRRAERRRSR